MATTGSGCAQESSSTDNRKKTLIFAYGTLKQGFPNYGLTHGLITQNDAVYIGTYSTTDNLPLVCGPFGIPYLINLPGSGHRVIGELYALSTQGLDRLDELEGVAIGHYERLPILVKGGGGAGGEYYDDGAGDRGIVKAEAYYAHRSYGEGMWKRNGEKGLREYTLEDANAYLGKGNRPKDVHILDAIRSFVACSPPSD